MSPRSVQPTNVVYRPGKGLEIASDDSEFKMATRLRTQMRYSLNGNSSQNEWSHGMQIRRARLAFTGNVFGKHNKYKFELAISLKYIGLSTAETISPPYSIGIFTLIILESSI